ncbi:MAG: hypothetical protein NC299_06735 [Lachnospiraceae bacterium]|nr:hypothetical protein [Ruminococcus sp.]MCM1275050.1 hypothetical protein [Lachnospiraceae bacterium]
MIELKLKKTALRLDFSFFAVIALFLLLDESGFGITALAACAVHELAHMLVMALFGISADEITFYGAGIRITSPQTEFAKPAVRALILSAGCLANFASAALFWRLGQPETAAIGLFTGVFNLLPIGELDGAGLLKMLLIRVCRPEKIDAAMSAASAAFAVICVSAMLFLGKGVSFTMITTALYFIIVSSRRI